MKKAPHILQNETGRTQGTGLCQFCGFLEAGLFFFKTIVEWL